MRVAILIRAAFFFSQSSLFWKQSAQGWIVRRVGNLTRLQLTMAELRNVVHTTWWGFREAALGLPFAFSSSSLPLAGHLENREENLFREARYLDFLSPGWTGGRQKKIRRANLFFQLLQNYNLQQSWPTKQLTNSRPTKQDLCWINVQLQSFD